MTIVVIILLLLLLLLPLQLNVISITIMDNLFSIQRRVSNVKRIENNGDFFFKCCYLDFCRTLWGEEIDLERRH